MNNFSNPKDNNGPDSIDPMHMIKISYAYWESRTLHVAVKFDIFSKLKDGGKSSSQLSKKCNANERGMEILLISCAAMGLLEKENGQYKNKPIAEKFLVRGNPDYQGYIITMFDNWYPFWVDLYEAVKTGKPVSKKQHDQGEEATRAYIMGLHNRALYQGEVLANAISLKGRKQLLDVGGGAGTFSIILCKANQRLKATVFDLPQTLKITKEIINQYNMKEHVTTQEGDYLKDSFIKNNDVILLESMIKQESVKTIKNLIKKSFDALVVGGLLIIDDQFLNAEKTGPLLPALIGENLLIQTPGGGSYSNAEIGEIIIDAGFAELSIKPLPYPSPNTLITAIKPKNNL